MLIQPDRKYELEGEAIEMAYGCAKLLAETTADSSDAIIFTIPNMTTEEAAFFEAKFRRRFLELFHHIYIKEAKKHASFRLDILMDKQRKARAK